MLMESRRVDMSLTLGQWNLYNGNQIVLVKKFGLARQFLHPERLLFIWKQSCCKGKVPFIQIFLLSRFYLSEFPCTSLWYDSLNRSLSLSPLSSENLLIPLSMFHTFCLRERQAFSVASASNSSVLTKATQSRSGPRGTCCPWMKMKGPSHVAMEGNDSHGRDWSISKDEKACRTCKQIINALFLLLPCFLLRRSYGWLKT